MTTCDNVSNVTQRATSVRSLPTVTETDEPPGVGAGADNHHQPADNNKQKLTRRRNKSCA